MSCTSFRRLSRLILAASAAFAAGCAGLGFSRGGAVGRPAPEFSLRELSGQPRRLSDWRGKAVLLDFWASWCGSCRDSIPLDERLHERYRAKGLAVVGVNEDVETKLARTAVERLGVSYPVLLDSQGWVFGAYGARMMPAMFLIDSSGTIRGRWEGFDGAVATEVEKAVEALMEIR